MTQETLIPKKRRGPVPTGQGTPVMVRLQPALLEAVDKFIAEELAGNASRPEAVRRLTAEALEKLGLLRLSDQG